MVETSNNIKYALGAAGALLMGYMAYRSMQSADPVAESQSTKESGLSFDQLKAALPEILKVIPLEWDGTTFNNSNLLGRPRFSEDFIKLVKGSIDTGKQITEKDLIDLGNAQDYLRVSTNISTVVETVYALKYNRKCDQIFTFASNAMPLFSVMMSAGNKTVKFYVGKDGNTEEIFDA